MLSVNIIYFHVLQLIILKLNPWNVFAEMIISWNIYFLWWLNQAFTGLNISRLFRLVETGVSLDEAGECLVQLYVKFKRISQKPPSEYYLEILCTKLPHELFLHIIMQILKIRTGITDISMITESWIFMFLPKYILPTENWINIWNNFDITNLRNMLMLK